MQVDALVVPTLLCIPLKRGCALCHCVSLRVCKCLGGGGHVQVASHLPQRRLKPPRGFRKRRPWSRPSRRRVSRVDLGGTEPELAGREVGCILSHLPPGTSGNSPEAGNTGLVLVSPGAASPGVEPWHGPTEGRVSTAGQAAGTLLLLLRCNLRGSRSQAENRAQKGARGGRRASGLRWGDPPTVSPRPHTRTSWLLFPDEL